VLTKKNKMKQLIIIPCCSAKVAGGIQTNQELTFFENIYNVPELIERRNERIKLTHPNIQEEELLPAWDRYNGRIYKRLKQHQPLINTLIAENKLDIIIISALYGVININTPIANYNLEMGALGGVNFWNHNHILSNSINEYCLQNDIENVYTFLRPPTYYAALIGLREHIQKWPNGLHGVNNINNHLADLIILRLMQINEL
jgi:cytoplasmic iron level regulating protein YaaA (DUF328/UPF0246 family)